MEADSIFDVVKRLHFITPFRDFWFRGSSNIDYGLLPGIIWREAMDRESTYVHKFLVRYQAYTDKSVSNPWERYALMQHHGLPTRLIDWTSSPFNALFFALNQDPDKNTDRVIWMLDPRSFNKYFHDSESIICPAVLESTEIRIDENDKNSKTWNVDSYLPQILDKHDHYKLPEKPIAMDSPFSNKRLAAQHGRFTLHGSNTESLDSQLKGCPDDKVLSAIILKTKDRLPQFVEQLDSIGINEETIYQDLDSMVRNIIRLDSRDDWMHKVDLTN